MSQDLYKGWALYYASLGWHVFPLKPGTKYPGCEHGSSEATIDTAQIERWWTASPNSGIGMRPAACGLYVLDMDPRNGGEASFAALQAEHGLLISPVMAVSGRGTGFHMYFAAPVAGTRYKGQPGPGLDGKHNGFVVLPPSIHPDTQQPYTWMTGTPGVGEDLPVAPAFLEKQIIERPDRVPRAVDPAELPSIKAALAFLDAEDNETWQNTMASMKHWGDHAEAEAEALEAFCEWSATSGKPEHSGNEHEIEKRWDSWSSDAPGARTIASVFHDAKAKGFRMGPDAKAAFDKMQDLLGMQQAAPLAEALNTHVPVPFTPGTYEPLAQLHVTQVPTMNDHLWDASVLRDSEGVFRNRLGSFEGAAHWWNGRCWEHAPDEELRRMIGISMISATVKTSSGRIKGTLEVLRDQLPRYGQADTPSSFVFFANGVLYTGTGELKPHEPEYRNSRTLSVDYDPASQCVQWLAWLADIFRSDLERISLLQEMLGWCLCRDHLGIEKSMIFIGPPRSGKGTIIKVLRALLGGGAGAFALPTLDDNKILSGMRGQNVSIDSDTASPGRNNARQIGGLFKTISSNEPVSLALLYTQTPWEGSLNCKLLLASNSIPTLFDDSGASANRWIPLAFDRSFLDHEQVDLADRLLVELPGIAAWAVQGLQRLMRNGRFTLPQSSRDELGNMLSSSSPTESYINDRLVVARGQRVSEADLWDDYLKWYVAEGLEQMKRRDFIRAIADALRGRGAVHKQSIRFGMNVLRGFEGVSLAQGNVVPIRSGN